ncbi:MAG: transcription-repair coupling factor [Phycisphaeraceae bacterium]|nr:transcription-repair coupling factor [Phycisphaeraceae bacterium]
MAKKSERTAGQASDPDATSVLSRARTDPATARLAAVLAQGKRVVASGSSGSSTTLLAAALASELSRPIVLVCAHLDDADESFDELRGLGAFALRLPALESLPADGAAVPDALAERLAVVREISGVRPDRPAVVVAPIQALMQGVHPAAKLAAVSRAVRRDEQISPTALIAWLDNAGYSRVEAIEEAGDFAVRGGIIDIFPAGDSASPVRFDFFGDQIERINEIDIGTMGADRAIDSAHLVAADVKLALPGDDALNFLQLIPPESVALLHETMEVVEQGRGYYERLSDSKGFFGPPAVLKILESRFHAIAEINQFSAGAGAADVRIDLPVRALDAFDREATVAVSELIAMTTEPMRCTVTVFCQNEGEEQRLKELLAAAEKEPERPIQSRIEYLHRGFIWGETEPAAFVPYHELLNRFTVRRKATRLRSSRALDTFLDFQPGDFVVHQDHGIAKFIGLTQQRPREIARRSETALANMEGRKVKEPELEEFLTLEFAGNAKLHVPATQIDLVQKYVGGFGGKPTLSTLGGQRWKGQKERTSESVKDLAAEMMRVRAAREAMPGVAFPGDTPWQSEFEEEFPYEETEDQLSGLKLIKQDMSKHRPMDRLICGDVGFGKTELAIRAAFKAVEFGKQVAVLVPTTVLAEQHERTFRQRFAGYPFKVESLSRFKTDAEAKEILEKVKKGQIDVIIGTHRILSKDVVFADLGLVVIDEEQRFGVEHKESLLRLRLTVDVLTLSATPIPRTLHMAMLGIRDISSLTTPPLDRRAIVTEVIPYNERRIQQAIARELSRDGQIFFVHNRVHDIKSVADNVQKMAPDARILIGHGQMNPHELEQVMLKFMRGPSKDGGADILVSTTIIESGIDIPTANTMVINDADRFGLAELHQLRGRVGRSKNRGYCYLLLPPERSVNDIARKRLRAIEQYSMLGAGFKIAMRDLEIRGAGNILGAEQSGHIAAVGYDMYCRLLEDAVHELKNEKPPEKPSTVSIEIGLSASIPKPYIPSDQRRLEAYRRIATASTREQLEQVKADLTSAYGEPPKQVNRLLFMSELRIAAVALGVKSISVREKDVIFKASRAKELAERLARTPPELAKAGKALQVSVTVLPAKTGAKTLGGGIAVSDELAEVYFRPPEKYLEPETLLSVLRKRLQG